MRESVLLAAILVALSGCAQIEAFFKSLPPFRERSAPSSSPSLRPQLPAEEEQRLMEDARRKIAEVERLFRDLEGRQMKPPQEEMFLTAKNFMDQARSAFGARDYQRAVNLASKAQALGDDLAALTK